MVRFTLAQMRLSLPRLIAGALAIVIGTAFIAATLVGTSVMTQTARNAVTAGYAGADIVVNWDVTEEQLATIRAAAGVEVAAGQLSTGVTVEGPAGRTSIDLASHLPDARLEPQKLVSGAWPAIDQIALPSNVAERLGLRIGDQATVVVRAWMEGKNGEDEKVVDTRTPVTVSGLVQDPAGAFSREGGQAVGTQSLVTRVAESDPGAAGGVSPPSKYRTVLVIIDEGASPVEVADRLQATFSAQDDDGWPRVQTVTDRADEELGQFTNGANGLTAFVLAFAAIALLVAGLVIANTFQVLVAQRTRHLALLRCIGAVKAQVRRAVLLEGAVTGLAASLVGVLVGALIAQAMLVVLRQLKPEVPLPAMINLTWVDVLLPLLIGTVVTVAAALVPARSATRVSALAALRPQTPPRARQAAGRTRLALSLILVVLGIGLLGLGVFESMDGWSSSETGLLIAVFGGAVSFLGVLVSAVFWAPRLAAGIGWLAARFGGAPATLAAANSARNPRRTAATMSALLIGVTLVTTVSTAAASARSTLDRELDSRYPVDVVVGQEPNWSPEGAVLDPPVTPEQLAAVAGVKGVAKVARAGNAVLEFDVPEGVGRYGLAGGPVLVTVVDDAAAALIQDERTRKALLAGRAVVDRGYSDLPSLGHSIQVRHGELSAWTKVPVTWATEFGANVILPESLMGQLGVKPVATQLWVTLDHDRAAAEVVSGIQAALTSATPRDASGASSENQDSTSRTLSVDGMAVRRAEYDHVIDTLLAVVLGLLGVAVLIAILGVANTLALSVIERRRESATLRAIGLTRRQLRATLAVEGTVIAAAGALAGIGLGLVYGWVGASTVFAGLVRLRAAESVTFGLAVPWVQVLAIMSVALLAGLLASVLPSRSASRSSPIAALAAD
jgi:putative ABC transport system permease protein